jgi:hypothetical protein
VKQATLTSSNTIGVFNSTQFENVDSLIQIKSSILGGGGLWTTGSPSTRIYYNGGNVGIGTTDPQNKLHIRDDTNNTTALTVQNNFTTAPIPTEIVVVGATSTIIGTTERCVVFPYSGTGTTKDYTFTTTENLICDILIVGGGGGGGYNRGGGGGAGGLVFNTGVILSGVINISVGKDGIPSTANSTNAGSGVNFSINSFVALGGSGGASVLSFAI